MTSVALFTSIAPRKVEEQLAALATWRGFATRIVTVNEVRESALLVDLPDWIERATFDDEIPYPRPYVRLSKLAEAMERGAAGADRVAFCNSDISLADKDDLQRILDFDQESALIFSSRTDTDEEGQPISVYTDGFDFFCFRPEQARLIAHPDMYIGLPWWDFLVPLAFVRAGQLTTRLDGHHVHHRKHAQKWDPVQYYEKASIVLRRIAEWDDARPFEEAEVSHFAWQVNTFLNSRRLVGTGRSSQQAALESLAALWRKLHASQAKNGWAMNVAFTRRLYFHYIQLAVAVSGNLRKRPGAYRVARGVHRGFNRLLPRRVKRTPAGDFYEIVDD
jgi:hypothetical protein